jgi:hypothetical protein
VPIHDEPGPPWPENAQVKLDIKLRKYRVVPMGMFERKDHIHGQTMFVEPRSYLLGCKINHGTLRHGERWPPRRVAAGYFYCNKKMTLSGLWGIDGHLGKSPL